MAEDQLGADYAAAMQQTAERFDKLDNALTEVRKTQVDHTVMLREQSGVLLTLSAQATIAESRLDTMDARLNAVDARLGTMDLRFGRINERLADIEAGQSELSVKMDTVIGLLQKQRE